MPDLCYTKIDPLVPDLARGSDHAAGIDLYCTRNVWLEPNDAEIVRCGIAVAIPEGHFGLVTARSGLGFKQGIASHIGIVDADFRGELQVKLYNHSHEEVSIPKYTRFAQLTIVPYAHLIPLQVDELSDTLRGERGYGSTGIA